MVKTSRLSAIKDIYRKRRAGHPVRRSAKRIENFLRKNRITRARHDDIVDCAERDLDSPAPTTGGGLHVHTFLKECFDADVKKKCLSTKIQAYGNWTTEEAPRSHGIYRALAICAGSREFEDGIYGAWERDVRPILLDMDALVASTKSAFNDWVRVLEFISVAMEISPSIDHEGRFAEAYATLQSAKVVSRDYFSRDDKIKGYKDKRILVNVRKKP